MSAARRRAALKAFKRHGYVVQVGALELVLAGYDELQDAGGEDADGRDGLSEYLELIMDALARAMTMDGGGASILSAGAAMDAVERVRADTSRASGFGGAALELIDIFTIPNPARARRMGTGLQQRSAATGTAVLDAQPEAKAELFRARYDLLLQKTLRNPRFTPPASSLISASVSGGGSKAGGSKSPYLQLTAIDSLRGTHGDRLVLGMLTQLEEGSWFLEDINGSIEVDLSEAHTTAGLHTDSSFVIAQGQMIDLEVDDGVDSDRPIFKVFAMGTPPLEEREKTFKALGREAHLFGGRYDYSDESSMLELEEAAVDAMIVILSDVFLDDPRVVTGLRLIFHGYLEDGVVPTAFVLMGSFLSHPFGQRSNDGAALISAFTSLGEMIAADFPQLAAQTTFVVVPGPNDAGPGNILPRPSILPILVEGFIAALSPERVMLGTNPCRLRYMTQEVVLFREDLLHKMLRNCAVKPDNSDTGVMAEHMVKSIVDQAHLCPLPLVSRPLLWAHDHAMWLFPSPHLVVIADKVEGYTFSYGSTTGLNPGSFGSDLSFVVYLPAERKSQQCTLDPAELASPMDIAERTQSANSVDYESQSDGDEIVDNVHAIDDQAEPPMVDSVDNPDEDKDPINTVGEPEAVARAEVDDDSAADVEDNNENESAAIDNGSSDGDDFNNLTHPRPGQLDDPE